MKQRFVRKQGFTLIELMIVIAIIGVLAVMGGANYISSLKRSRDSRRMADLEQVRGALEMYRTDNDDYPLGNYVTITEVLNPGYLKSIPSDPGGTNSYVYESDGPTYELCAQLEMTSPGTCIFDAGYNYGVTEP